MSHAILEPRSSRAFAPGEPILEGVSPPEAAEVVLACGGAPSGPLATRAIALELGSEGLAVHIGEDRADPRLLGFARYRNGADAPSNLIELVRGPATAPEALTAARKVFEAHGFTVCVCADRPGRIVDRLVRPKYNAALKLLDEGLASREDIDATCRLGLGYPDGPIERVLRGGLEQHYDVTRALFEALAEPGFAPARRAAVAHARRGR